MGGAKEDKHSPPGSNGVLVSTEQLETSCSLIFIWPVPARPSMPAHQCRFARRKRAPPVAALFFVSNSRATICCFVWP